MHIISLLECFKSFEINLSLKNIGTENKMSFQALTTRWQKSNLTLNADKYCSYNICRQ